MWVYFALTVVSTLYFGWHYIADDIAGAAIAFVSVWLGGLATGQKFDRHGRGSHPTTSTAERPGAGRGRGRAPGARPGDRPGAGHAPASVAYRRVVRPGHPGLVLSHLGCDPLVS